MNPAALKANLARPAQGRDADRRHPRLHRPRAGPRRLDAQPARGRHARRLPRARPRPHRSSPWTRSRTSSSPARTPAASKNMFALGLLSWMYSRPTEGTLELPHGRSSPTSRTSPRPTSPRSRPAGTSARRPRRSRSRYEVKPAPLPPGTYRNITGNLALSYGLIAASQRSGPAAVPRRVPDHAGRDILHELSKHKRFGVRTFQAEDEIAGIGAALGAAFGGALAVTTSSGPGHRAEGRDDRPGGVARAAADHLRHPARRPVDRPADQDRAVRPAAGDVRPQRRGAGADRRRRSRRATASTPRSRRPGSR